VVPLAHMRSLRQLAIAGGSRLTKAVLELLLDQAVQGRALSVVIYTHQPEICGPSPRLMEVGQGWADCVPGILKVFVQALHDRKTVEPVLSVLLGRGSVWGLCGRSMYLVSHVDRPWWSMHRCWYLVSSFGVKFPQ
jgi:hypothetical protein